MRELIKVSEQTLWQLLGKIVSSSATFITIALIARNYGQEGVGVYTLATTYLTMFFVVVDLGLNAYVLTLLEQGKQEAVKLFNVRFYWSLFLLVIAIVLSYLLPIGDGLFKLAVLLGVITIVANGIFASANLVFQYKLRFDKSMMAVSLGAIASVFLAVFLISAKVPSAYIILSLTLGWSVNSLVSLILISKYYKFRISRPDFNYFLNLLKKVWPVSITLVLNVIYFRFDSFILAAYRSLSEVGIYNLSFTIFQTALVLPTFIMNSYYPIILKELTKKKQLIHQLKTAFFMMLGISLIGTILTWLLSPFLIHLVGGDEFKESVSSINILALSFPAFFCSALLMWILVSFKKYLNLFFIYLFGLLLNITLNIIFTPTYSYLATSWITVISEYFVLTLQLLVLWLEFKKGHKLWN